FGPNLNGQSLSIYEDAKRTADGLTKISVKDSKAYPDFITTFARIGRVLAPLLTMTPPSIDAPSKRELWNLANLGLKVRGLGRKDEYRLLRYGPMAVADLAAEWFETELLRAVVAARGIFGAFAGPWSAGTSAPLLLQAATNGQAIAPASFVKGGMGALALAVAKVNLALSALPKFDRYRTARGSQRVSSEAENLEKLSGRIQIGPDIDYLERAFDAAKYGDFSPRPYLDITIPSLIDSSLAPKGAHVMSIHAQFAPYRLKDGDWNSRREELGDAVVNTLADYAPNLKELIVARHVLTPLDLEKTFGLTGGHTHHGEMSLDQLFAFRPLIGWAQYRTPIEGLYLCGAGTHPGGGVTGAPGLNASREIIKDLKRRKT